jgi:hypothetical protein
MRLKAYTAAGRTLQLDLFSKDRGDWIVDAALLERLGAEWKEHEGETIRAKGWCWLPAARKPQPGRC